MKYAVFIERDGVLNHVQTQGRGQVSPLAVADFHIVEDAKPLLDELKEAGFMIIATTNQPGLCRGYQSRGELDRMHKRLRAALPLDDLLVCPHDEMDVCPCRKPRPGLFTEAAFKWKISFDQSFVISDKWQDAEAARACGCTSVLIESPWIGHVHRDFLVPSLHAAVEKVLSLSPAGQLALA